MTKEDFLRRAAETLEVEAVSESTEFRRLPGWCSMKAFGLMVLVENGLGVRIDVERFRSIRTIGELYDA